MNIMLVEDDQEIARLTSMYLKVEGYETTEIHDGAKVPNAVRQSPPDLILLDLMLPGLSGMEICTQVRSFYHGPIIVLTACDDEISEVCLLKLGADDYLVKPIKPHILIARIEALQRRYQHIQRQNHPQYVSRLTLDNLTHTFSYDKKVLALTTAEYEMLNLLYENMGQVVCRERCSQAFRGKEYHFIDRSIDMRISALRKKLGDINMPYRKIITIRNKGYMLTDG